MDSVSFGSECGFNRDLYKAAIKGEIQPFTDGNQQLDLILTPIKNTILHVHLSSETQKSISFVRQMLEKCPSLLLQVNANGHTPQTRKSREFVRKMLEKCPSLLLQVNANGDTPLHVAARHGNSSIVKVLIECAKTQPQDTESGLTYMQLMIRKSNNEGNSALHEAVVSDYVRVVKILTKEDPEFSHFANNLGETPLFIAAERACLSSLRKILKRCKSAAHEGPHGMTALHVAAMNNHKGITRELLKNKKCLTKNRNENGWTPLHFAAYDGCPDITKLLLDSDISAAYVADKDRKMTPLHVAVSNAFPLDNWYWPKQFYGHMQITEEIISQCPDCCQMVDDRGWNVLHFAMTMLPVQQLNTLLENPILRDLVTKKDARGNTPLHVLAACRPREYHRIKKKLEGKRYHYAVNKQNDTIHEIIFLGSPQLQEEIQELSSSDGTGPYWRGVINENPFWIFTELSRFEKTKDSEMVVATLIATVTFTAALTMPGGYRSEKGPDQGTAFLSRKAAFQAFVITDATAFVLSLAAVFIHFFAARNLSALWFFRAYTRLLISLAIVAVVVAFSTGTYAVLSPSLGFAIATCLIGLSFFLGIFTLIYLRCLWKHRILK
ncbi:hypothetical protein Patl1_05790 [Pistacia atlantica]|uniref:Uncharacterized protein n=1 Tax=Pistacia atlantica TaxID=434234 RepID=A0ACC1BT31_9ROSI|nr:hypothetical protein Patl1_05790 [Pistacia atlantica]